MTTEEKLQNFYNHSLDSANREAERVIGDHQKALDKIFEEHKATARRQAEEEVAAETEKAKRDVNKTLSADQLHIRRKLSRKNLELKEKLFKEVREKLTAYKKDPSYEEYLERKIRELHRCSDALGEAVYTPPHTPGAPSRAASSRRDRPLTSVSKQSAHTVSPPRTHGHRYASAHDGSGAKHTSHRRICVPPPFICKVIMHSDNFLHQFILVRIICQAVFLRLHKNRARLFLHARRVLLF